MVNHNAPLEEGRWRKLLSSFPARRCSLSGSSFLCSLLRGLSCCSFSCSFACGFLSSCRSPRRFPLRRFSCSLLRGLFPCCCLSFRRTRRRTFPARRRSLLPHKNLTFLKLRTFENERKGNV